jgi:hypothetical protein
VRISNLIYFPFISKQTINAFSRKFSKKQKPHSTNYRAFLSCTSHWIRWVGTHLQVHMGSQNWRPPCMYKRHFISNLNVCLEAIFIQELTRLSEMNC